MIRLVIYAVLLCLGAWAGAEFTRVQSMDACLNAGGSVDPRGFCAVTR